MENNSWIETQQGVSCTLEKLIGNVKVTVICLNEPSEKSIKEFNQMFNALALLEEESTTNKEE
jgi:hypothetical protein